MVVMLPMCLRNGIGPMPAQRTFGPTLAQHLKRWAGIGQSP